jgi:hypothetical protein
MDIERNAAVVIVVGGILLIGIAVLLMFREEYTCADWQRDVIAQAQLLSQQPQQKKNLIRVAAQTFSESQPIGCPLPRSF